MDKTVIQTMLAHMVRSDVDTGSDHRAIPLSLRVAGHVKRQRCKQKSLGGAWCVDACSFRANLDIFLADKLPLSGDADERQIKLEEALRQALPKSASTPSSKLPTHDPLGGRL